MIEMIQALAYGIQIDINLGAGYEDMSIIESIDDYIGKRTSMVYLDRRTPNKMAGLTERPVVLVSCLVGPELIFYLVSTESFTTIDSLDKWLPRTLSSWDDMIIDQFDELERNLTGEGCKISSVEWSPTTSLPSPRWLLLESDR
jgi:hypothetical protein